MGSTDLSRRSPLSNGGFVICWTSFEQDSSWDGIFGQIYNEWGVKVGNEFGVNTYTAHKQSHPDICALQDGKFIIVWVSYEQDGSEYGVYGQIFDENGNHLGSEFRVNTAWNVSQGYPSISSLDGGGFVVCWIEYMANDISKFLSGDINLQMFDESGVKIGTESDVSSFSDYKEISPSICGLTNNGFIVSWEGRTVDGREILAQLYDDAGIKKGEKFKVNSFRENDQSEPRVSKLDNDRFIICWQSWGQDGSKLGVFAQIYNNTGSKYGSEFRVNDYKDDYQQFPAVTGVANNKVLLCWESWEQDGSGYGIFGKKFNLAPIDHDLSPFELLEPTDNDTSYVTNPVVFTWEKANEIPLNLPWELTYSIYIDVNINFSNHEVIQGIQDTVFQIDSLVHGQTYFWKVLAKNIAGDSLWSENINRFIINNNTTNIADNEQIAELKFQLFQNYPNPFNPTTIIKYKLTANSQISLKIYDILGNVITTLVNEKKPPGVYDTIFDSRMLGSNGRSLASGIYFYRLQSGDFIDTKKFLLIK